MGYIYFFVGAFFVFLLGMSGIVLIDFAALFLGEDWLSKVNDFTSILASMATFIGLPWAIWTYKVQKDREHEDQVTKYGMEIYTSLKNIFENRSMLKNPVITNSMLSQLEGFKESNPEIYARKIYLKIQVLFNNFLKTCACRDLTSYDLQHLASTAEYEDALSDIGVENAAYVSSMAYTIIKNDCFVILTFSGDMQYQSKVIIESWIPSLLLKFSNPILYHHCKRLNNPESAKALFHLCKEVATVEVASFIYLFNSVKGRQLLVDLDEKVNNGRNTYRIEEWLSMTPESQHEAYFK